MLSQIARNAVSRHAYVHELVFFMSPHFYQVYDEFCDIHFSKLFAKSRGRVAQLGVDDGGNIVRWINART